MDIDRAAEAHKFRNDYIREAKRIVLRRETPFVAAIDVHVRPDHCAPFEQAWTLAIRARATYQFIAYIYAGKWCPKSKMAPWFVADAYRELERALWAANHSTLPDSFYKVKFMVK